MRLIRSLWCRLGCIKSGSVFCRDPFRSLPSCLNGKYQAPFTHTNTTYSYMQSHNSQKRAWRSCVLVRRFEVTNSLDLISLSLLGWFLQGTMNYIFVATGKHRAERGELGSQQGYQRRPMNGFQSNVSILSSSVFPLKQRMVKVPCSRKTRDGFKLATFGF